MRLSSNYAWRLDPKKQPMIAIQFKDIIEKILGVQNLPVIMAWAERT